jgi:hypothetical protein
LIYSICKTTSFSYQKNEHTLSTTCFLLHHLIYERSKKLTEKFLLEILHDYSCCRKWWYHIPSRMTEKAPRSWIIKKKKKSVWNFQNWFTKVNNSVTESQMNRSLRCPLTCVLVPVPSMLNLYSSLWSYCMKDTCKITIDKHEAYIILITYSL